MPAPTQSLTIAADLAELARVMTMIDDFSTRMSIGATDVSALHLALEEIVTNVITHGYQGNATRSLSVQIEALAADRIRASVTDAAPAYNPLARPEVNTSLPLEARPVGGLGVHLVRKLMDVCFYEHRDGQNIFTIERQLGRAAGAAASMSIAASRLAASATLTLSGRLDGLSSPDLERLVSALITSGVRTLTFDLSSLDYVSSAGLRIFIIAAKKLKAGGGEARFTDLSPAVHEVFQISGLLTALGVAPRA
ncbi:anti-sigma factor antagonist [Prosthecobacter vanneervenii]|uniref:Anti-sigma factor antagonist n=1 Tax=Prosthecobacter vanneervenii TaxID=48466 RepID=A0A7W8DLC9_9BACT|nr:anti-anti-sigma factor [Prosthecobacter vanneervenii]